MFVIRRRRQPPESAALEDQQDKSNCGHSRHDQEGHDFQTLDPKDQTYYEGRGNTSRLSSEADGNIATVSGSVLGIELDDLTRCYRPHYDDQSSKLTTSNPPATEATSVMKGYPINFGEKC